MECLVCNTKMEPYFEKKYDIKTHIFERCPSCGLVINSTVYNMSEAEWSDANNVHKSFQGEIDTQNPSWKKRISRLQPQAELVYQLYINGLFDEDTKAVDYGGGDGLFSEMIQKDYLEKCHTSQKKFLVKTYEKYLQIKDKDGYYNEQDMTPKSFDLAICSAVLEHMIGREDVDYFFNLVNDTGVAIIHTLICESVPQDPDWFYISMPVHCTLWTNEAMSRIYTQHGFVGCAYHLPSKMWLFFKDSEKYNLCKDISSKIPGEWTFSPSFVDYWKAPPYHHHAMDPR
ncbi:methyltransferase domain-containing protein [Butyrivibrio sp. FC2001]|uniref:methyltransferase domain-containing protein n=1 Tax=Butyrivibrio sp. FC2001 TaxID=1280671 RepID=UPI000424D024|nr:methyltransferase domain-containing protein [Butyrivibrio sp. FC2001]